MTAYKFAVIPAPATLDDRLTDGEFRILSHLCAHLATDGRGTISQKQIATDLSVSREHVVRSIKTLKVCGYIEIVRQQAVNGAKQANFYQINHDFPTGLDHVIEGSQAHVITTSTLIVEDHKDPPIEGDGDHMDVIHKSRGSNSKRGTRIEEHWQPDTKLREWAIAEREDLNIKIVIESFVDYWITKPGASALKLDWGRTFKTWVRREDARGSVRRPDSDRNQASRRSRIMRAAAVFEQDKRPD